MKFQKITTVKGPDKTVYWAASKAEAANYRKVAVDSGVARKNITTEEVNVPTDKEGLLEFLNKECV